jgi:MFS family permease
MFFLGSLYLERVLGYSALEIGLAFMPVTIFMGTLSVRYTEPLISRFGAKRMVLAGMTLITVGLLLFTRTPVDGSYLQNLLAPMILFGTGAGLAFPALMTVAMSGATADDAGLASGLVNTSAQVGGALGLAVLATVSASRSDSLIADGEATASALTSGYHLAFLIGALLVVAAIAVTIRVVQPEELAEEQAARAAAPGEEKSTLAEAA